MSATTSARSVTPVAKEMSFLDRYLGPRIGPAALSHRTIDTTM